MTSFIGARYQHLQIYTQMHAWSGDIYIYIYDGHYVVGACGLFGFGLSNGSIFTGWVQGRYVHAGWYILVQYIVS